VETKPPLDHAIPSRSPQNIGAKCPMTWSCQLPRPQTEDDTRIRTHDISAMNLNGHAIPSRFATKCPLLIWTTQLSIAIYYHPVNFITKYTIFEYQSGHLLLRVL
jgi:hypothetical protein